MTFQNFLQFVLDMAAMSGNQFSHIHVKDDDGILIAKASSENGGLHMSVSTKDMVEDYPHGVKGCLGNLGMLRAIFQSPMLGSGTMDVQTMKRNDKELLACLEFKSKNGRAQMLYEATDPFRGSVVKPAKTTISDWPVTFGLNEAAQDEIREMKKIYGLAPGDGDKQQQDIMSITLADGGLLVSFGNGRNAVHRSNIALDAMVDASVDACTVMVLGTPLISAFSRFIDAEKTVYGQMADRGLKLLLDTEGFDAELEFVGQKLRSD